MSASITDICEAIRDVLASAIGARVKFASIPTGVPAPLPAAVVQYLRTEAAYANHNARATDGKQIASGAKRTHRGTLYAILSQTGDRAAEAKDIERAAQSILDAFDADARLTRGGVDMVARFRLGEVRAWNELVESSTTPLAGVTAEWEAIEL